VRKKVQAALPIWMEEYLMKQAEKHDLTLSEIIRIGISLAIICLTQHKYSSFKTSLEGIGIPAGKLASSDDPEKARIISDIYFEARKAIEFREEKEKK